MLASIYSQSGMTSQFQARRQRSAISGTFAERKGRVPMVATGAGVRLEETARDLFEVVTQLGLTALRGRRRSGDLKEVEFLTLAILHGRGTMIVGDIQRLLGVLPAQMSRIIRSLETRDRPLIASVIYNRLRLGMPLEVDASIEYVFPEHHNVITKRDLQIDSPYNTYRHTGLPPTPIANPGKASLDAAFKPANTQYLYYVAKPDGHSAFAKTLQEHNANVDRYLK